MPTQRIGKPDPPKKLSDTTRRERCAEWDRLEAERLHHQAAASARSKLQETIERELEAQLAIDGVDAVAVAKWEFGRELVAARLSFKDELVKEVGIEEVERRQKALARKPKFFLRARPDARRRAA